MRILVISDVHGDKRIVDRIIDLERPDGILCAGDLTYSKFNPDRFISYRDIEDIASRVDGNFLTITGNHEVEDEVVRDSRYIIYRDFTVREFMDMRVMGLCGNFALKPRYWHHRDSNTVLTQFLRERNRLRCNLPHIVLAHECIYPYADFKNNYHQGSLVYNIIWRWLAVSDMRPLWITGHIHRQQIDIQRRVVNVGATCNGDYVMLNIDKGDLYTSEIELKRI